MSDEQFRSDANCVLYNETVNNYIIWFGVSFTIISDTSVNLNVI